MEIVDNCRGRYRGLRPFVAKAVNLIGADIFAGVSEISLEDNISEKKLLVPKSVSKAWEDGFRVGGYYVPEQEGYRCSIALFSHEVTRGIPFLLRKSPLVLLRIIGILAHEVGHHLKEQESGLIGDSEGDDEEDLAEDFRRRVTKRILSENSLGFWRFVQKELASWHFAFGLADYKSNELQKAEDHFYTALQIFPENESAKEWFWYVRHKFRNYNE